jgi:hypothetical protein
MAERGQRRVLVAVRPGDAECVGPHGRS